MARLCGTFLGVFSFCVATMLAGDRLLNPLPNRDADERVIRAQQHKIDALERDAAGHLLREADLVRALGESNARADAARRDRARVGPADVAPADLIPAGLNLPTGQ